VQDLIALFLQVPSLEEIVRWGEYAGLFLISFAETGLLVGFFLPGDSLLVTAGLFAARGELDIVLLIIAAITGMTLTGYFLGRSIPGIEKHIEYIIAVVIFLSILPLIIKYIQHKRKEPVPPPLNDGEPGEAQGT